MNLPQFPCEILPADQSAARLLGLYPQRQEGLWMQRVRIPGGRLSADQWAASAAIARELTPGEPLHLTTRQDIEFHGLPAETVPAVQERLASTGLTTVGACGDTSRNVTVCPCSGVANDAPDLRPLAAEILAMLQSQPGAFSLPRKFKVSLSACPDNCGMPWIHDLSFTAVPHDDGWRFRVILAGSLGPRPATGIDFGRLIAADKVLPFALAACRVFAAAGDREHRQKARLRHVRERMGDAAFRELLDQQFAAALAEQPWPAVHLTTPDVALAAKVALRFEDGNLDPETAEALGDLHRRSEIRVVIGNHHQVWVFGQSSPKLDAALNAAGLHRFSLSGPRIVACPGTRWCSRGLADTADLAQGLRNSLAGRPVGDVLIGISGCPNGCAHSAVADVGVVGLLAGGRDRREQVWNILAGGEGGRGPGLARPVANRLRTNDAAELIAELAAAVALRLQVKV